MKREIKFRAWDKNMSNPFEMSAPFNPFFYGGVFTSNCVFMQFTGLTDKNGVEIYEGDIFSKASIDELGNNIDYFYIVKWSSSNQGFRCYRYRLDENENGLYWRKQTSDESLVMVVMYNHVIGNIHQNPELL